MNDCFPTKLKMEERQCVTCTTTNTMQRITVLALLVLSGTAQANDYSTPYGEWRGQTQYQAFVKGVSDPTAHSVINLTISLDPAGKVVGTSTDNSCRFLGLATPGVTLTLVTLNVTLTNCTYAGYNRTYMGLLSVFSKERYAKFSLQAVDVTPGRGGTFNITSTMRR